MVRCTSRVTAQLTDWRGIAEYGMEYNDREVLSRKPSSTRTAPIYSGTSAQNLKKGGIKLHCLDSAVCYRVHVGSVDRVFIEQSDR